MANFVIDSEDKLKQKIDLVSNLCDIKIAIQKGNKKKAKQPKQAKKGKELEPNPVDENYESLNCKISTLAKNDKDFKMIDEYLANTSRGRGLKLKNVFKLKRDGEDKIFNPNKLGNKKLLWHGSLFSNFVGILSQGLRIAPPEAPKSGYNFGKGVYFADLAGKSAAYCRTYNSNGTGLLLLCEVALGKP